MVALSFARGPRAALDGLDELQLEGSLEHYQPYYAARADVLRRCGRPDAAANAYRRALALSGNATERRFLEHRLREVLN